MPKAPSKDTTPDKLKPFMFHGVDLSWKGSDNNAVGECPWCGKEGKFSVKITTGQWRCLVCGEGSAKGGGNIQTFIELLWKQSIEATTERDYEELVEDRGILATNTLVEWGIAKSFMTSEWLIPGFNSKSKLATLYKRGTKAPFPTPTLGHHLHGVNLYKKQRDVVFLCEGPWDGIAWWEMLARSRDGDNGLVLTGNRKNSLLADCNVLAVPGCETFLDAWLPLFKGKKVSLCYDSDHPRTHPKTGKTIEPTGYKAMRRIAGLLLKVADSVSYLNWGEGGYDANLPSGTDVRDYLNYNQ